MFDFLSSPYTSRNSYECRLRYEAAVEASLWLEASGITVYSPIVKWHPVLQYRPELGSDALSWLRHNHVMIEASKRVLVLCISGWIESAGVTDERAFAASINKPIGYIYRGDKGYGIYEVPKGTSKDATPLSGLPR